MKRLYIFTGKGGVGKTTLALAMTNYLHKKGLKVFYNSLDQFTNNELVARLNIPEFKKTSIESAEEYIEGKLGSHLIAKGIVSTPFFNSLFNMVPGLSFVIYMGHIIDLLEKNPDTIIVIDSPSTGHIKTVFESIKNFGEIFRAGMIFDDIQRMQKFLYSPENLKLIISCLPAMMPINEGQELVKYFKNDLQISDCEIILNDCYSKMEGLDYSDLPSSLQTKIDLENEVINKFKQELRITIPHFTNDETIALCNSVEKFISVLGDR